MKSYNPCHSCFLLYCYYSRYYSVTFINVHAIKVLHPTSLPLLGMIHKFLLLSHVNNTADAITLLHIVESLVYVCEWLPVGDKLVDLQLARHVIIDQVRKLAATLNSAKGTSLETQSANFKHEHCGIYLPNTTSNKLECCENVNDRS
jgi:hypothetical protein